MHQPAGWADHQYATRVLSMATDGSDPQVLVDGLTSMPDGISVDHANRHIFYSFMGFTRTGEDFWESEGHVERCNYDGSDRQVVVPVGSFVTGKQLVLNDTTERLYWCDREGMAVLSCRRDGSDPRTEVRTGSGEDRLDARSHCVGVAVDAKGGWLYWTLKGKLGVKSGKGFYDYSPKK